jgi:hypothetical protein
MKTFYINYDQIIRQSVYESVIAETKEEALKKFNEGDTEGDFTIVSEETIDIENIVVEKEEE